MTHANYDTEQARRFFEQRSAFTTGTHELQVLLDSDADPASYQVVDVRFPADYADARIPGAVNLPMPKWDQAAYLNDNLDRNATLYVYCYTPTCHLAAQAAAKLAAAGYRVVEVEGGWEDWVSRGFPVEKGVSRERRLA